MERVFVGATITSEQLRAVACHESSLALDVTAVDKVKACATAAKRNAGVAASSAPVASASADGVSGSSFLSPSQTRAALVGICSQIAEARSSVRVEVLEALIAAINTPASRLTCPASSRGIADACREIVASSGVTLSDVEHAAVMTLSGGAAGVAALAATGASTLLLLADVAAALSVEAVQASSDAFESVNVDRVREVAAVIASASNIRLLLEGSREVGKAAAARKAGKEAMLAAADVAVMASAAAVNGGAAGIVAPAARVIIKEVNSAPSTAAHAEPGALPFHAAPIIAALHALAAAVEDMAAGSAARCTVLRLAVTAAALQATQAPPVEAVDRVTAACANASIRIADASRRAVTSGGVASVTAALEAGVAAQEAVDAALATLALEVATAESLIVAREMVAAVEAAAKEARRAAGAAARAAAMADEGGKKKAPRKEAAEPAASSIVNVLSLGVGCATVRAHLRSQGLSPVGAATDVSPAADVLRRVLAVTSPLGADVFGSSVAASVGSELLSGATTEAPQSQRFEALVRTTLDRIGAGGSRREPKIAKGTRDFLPEQMEVREACFNIIRAVFKRHGACEIDTPVFELRETLMGKYGEEGGKLVYDLADQGGELLSLRYDLTVPFARYVAMNRLDTLKRFHIARVYRRDNPAMARGRYREFYQCDYDVAGSYAPMMADAEVIAVGVEILASLPIGGFTLKLNHRGLLDAVLDIAGVPSAKFRSVCSAIDKLDKEPWEAVRSELIGEKGIPGEVADRIGGMVRLAGVPYVLLAQLKSDGVFGSHAGANDALASLHTLFNYLDALGALQHVTFDLSLARGLDYYTGVIYEAVLLDPSVGVGSIAAGGRYDHLVGMFSAAGTVVPCVGISIGVERVFTIMEAKARAAEALKRTPVSVLVASIPSKRRDMNVARMRVCAQLWAAGVSAQFVYADGPKLAKQMSEADAHGVPIAVILGEDEMDRGELQVKDLRARTAVNVPSDSVVDTVKRILAGASSAPETPAAAAVAVPASASAATAAAATGTIGVTVEGADRPYGRFSRPAVAV